MTTLLTILLLLGPQYARSEDYEKISLEVGAQKVLHWPRVSKISVSRRGIIHLLDQNQESWHVTGLRSGVVAVTLYLRGGERKTTYIEVKPKATSKPPKNFFLQDLSQVKSPSSSQTYLCRANVELAERHEVESLGGKTQSDLNLNLIDPRVVARATSQFDANAASIRRKVIASPLFVLTDGEEAEIKTGGETVHERTDGKGNQISVWHEYGLSLAVKVNEDSKDELRTEVLFVLKTPATDGTRYSLNQIQTQTRLKNGVNQLVGTVELSTEDQTGNKDLFLSQVPIIGPLFEHRMNSEAKATLRLWLEVTKE